MHPRTLLLALALGTSFAGTGPSAYAQHQHGGMQGMAGQMPATDTRIAVQFSEMMRTHTLTNMRDHLLALSEIQEALATGDVKPALAALAVTMKTCVACHATYRLE